MNSWSVIPVPDTKVQKGYSQIPRSASHHERKIKLTSASDPPHTHTLSSLWISKLIWGPDWAVLFLAEYRDPQCSHLQWTRFALWTWDMLKGNSRESNSITEAVPTPSVTDLFAREKKKNRLANFLPGITQLSSANTGSGMNSVIGAIYVLKPDNLSGIQNHFWKLLSFGTRKKKTKHLILLSVLTVMWKISCLYIPSKGWSTDMRAVKSYMKLTDCRCDYRQMYLK